jgi:peptide/nickel transport system permease protein
MQVNPSPFLRQNIWQKLTREKTAMAGLVIICIAILLSVFAYLVIPDSSPYANQQHLEMATCPPGFLVTMVLVSKNSLQEQDGFLKKMFYGSTDNFQMITVNGYDFDADRVLLYPFDAFNDSMNEPVSYRLADILFPLSKGGSNYVYVNDTVFFTDLTGKSHKLSLYDLQEKFNKEHLKVRRYLLGTDRFGRDFLSRLILGTRVSLSVGFISVLISLLIGISLGLAAGYFRGWTDQVIMWLISVIWSVPTLLMVIAVAMVLGKGFWQVFIAVGFTMWVEVARIVRGQVYSIREKEYIDAARVLGFGHLRILIRHILPNVLTPVIIISAANFASAILIEAGLSFLGMGVQPPVPSWGSMIKDHYGYIIVDKAYLALVPGLAIMIMVLSFTLLGNGLRDALSAREDFRVKGLFS